MAELTNTDVALHAGAVIEMQDPATGTWFWVPRVTGTTSWGEVSATKEKTTVESLRKEYGADLPDSDDKQLSGYVVPMNDIDERIKVKRSDQQRAFELARAKVTVGLRVTYASLERYSVSDYQLLGVQYPDGSASDWRSFQINGKSNSSTVESVVAALETITVSAESDTIAVGDSTNLSYTTTPTDAYYVPVGVYESSDTGIATVTADGVVTGVAEGSAQVLYRLDDGTESEPVSITVTGA